MPRLGKAKKQERTAERVYVHILLTLGALLFLLVVGGGCNSVNLWESVNDGLASATAKYTVQFLDENEKPITSVSVNAGSTVRIPAGISSRSYTVTTTGLYLNTVPTTQERKWYIFDTDDEWIAGSPVTDNLTLQGKWQDPDLIANSADSTGNKIADAIAYVNGHASAGGAYILVVVNDIECGQQNLSAYNARLTIQGSGSPTIRLSGQGSLFAVGSQTGNVSLTLGANITLQGSTSGNAAPLVMLESGAQFTMEPGSKICGNTIGDNGNGFNGGGVCVNTGATFTMNGGEISGNTAASGSGVCATGGGAAFTMNGGKIIGSMYVDGNVKITISGGTITWG